MKGKLYEGLSDGIYQIQPQHIPDVAAVLTVEVMRNNPVWKECGASSEELNAHFRNDVAETLRLQEIARQRTGRHLVINCFSVINQRLHAVIMHKRLKEYLQEDQIQKNTSIPLLKVLSEAGKKLMKNVNPDWDPQSTLYGTWGVKVDDPTVSAEVQKPRTLVVIAQGYNLMRWQGLLSRATSPMSVRQYQKMGGRVRGKTIFEYENNEYELFFVTLDTNEPRPQKILNMASSICLKDFQETPM